MNLNEYEGSFLFKSPSSSSHSFIPNIAKLEMFTYLESLVPWEKNSIFFCPLGLTNSYHKAPKIKFSSVRALKRYLNEKILIHGRVMATISEFSPHIFETYLSLKKKRFGHYAILKFYPSDHQVQVQIFIE